MPVSMHTSCLGKPTANCGMPRQNAFWVIFVVDASGRSVCRGVHEACRTTSWTLQHKQRSCLWVSVTPVYMFSTQIILESCTCRGYTPLDVCILEMQFRREQQDACGQGFMQHEDRYMKVIKHLLKANTKRGRLACLPIPQSNKGCTCGQCDNGYFSPRMQWRCACSLHALILFLCSLGGVGVQGCSD